MSKPEYEAGVLFDGWGRVRIQARNRDEAVAMIRGATVKVMLVDSQNNMIGVVEDPLFTTTIEDVETCRPSMHEPYRDKSQASSG